MSRAPQRLREPSPSPLEQTSVERQDCLSRRLYGAVARGKTATFDELLSEGANPNWAHPLHDGRTPLHVAAQNGRPDFILGLLRAGANIANTDDRGRTALDLFLKGKTCIAGCLFMRKASSYDCLALLTQAHQVHPNAIDIYISETPSFMYIGAFTYLQAHDAGADFVARLAALPPVVAHLAALLPCPGSPPSHDAAEYEYIAVIHPGDELGLACTPGTPRHTARSLGLTRPHTHTV